MLEGVTLLFQQQFLSDCSLLFRFRHLVSPHRWRGSEFSCNHLLLLCILMNNCSQKAIAKKGVAVSRGLGPTLAREVRSYGKYFLIHGLLIQLPVTQLGSLASLGFGILTGMTSGFLCTPGGWGQNKICSGK